MQLLSRRFGGDIHAGPFLMDSLLNGGNPSSTVTGAIERIYAGWRAILSVFLHYIFDSFWSGGKFEAHAREEIGGQRFGF